MQLNEYQNIATKYSVLRGKDISKLMFLALGTAGEAGEIADKVKKIFRDNEGVVHSEQQQKLKMELGDLLWYISEMANFLELDLEDIAKANLVKIEDRKQRGVIGGEGENR